MGDSMRSCENNNLPQINDDFLWNYNGTSAMPYQIPCTVPILPVYGYDNSEEVDKDCRYMKSMYPATAKRIQREVEEECDKLEYEGSCMFDEYPDRVRLGMITERIYQRLDKEEIVETEAMQYGNRWDGNNDKCRGGNCHNNRRQDNLPDLIDIMLFNEMQHRRRRHRSRKHWF